MIQLNCLSAHLNHETRKYWVTSIAIHLSLVAALGLFIFIGELAKQAIDEIPIDYIEVKRAALGETQTPVKKKAAPKIQKTTNDVSTASTSTTNTTETTQTNTASEGGFADGTAAEEYEVSEMPILVSEMKVSYPIDSKSKGIQGRVLIDIIIDTEGKVRKAILVSGPAEDLNQAALSAVKSFKFRPAKKDGKSVAVKIRYAYRFILD